MTRRRWALLCCLLTAMSCSERVRAGVWDIDPLVGVLADYSSDPALVRKSDVGATSGAFQADIPTAYVEDGWKLRIDPSFRVGDSRGYSSLASDYAHLTVGGEYDTDRGTLTATGGLSRDSNLYFNDLTNGSIGVRRDGSTADLSWDQVLTERLELNLDGNAQRVLFGERFGVPTLNDYNYYSINPALVWRENERDKVTLSASLSRYDSLNSVDQNDLPVSTQSRSANLQVGFVRQLDELWTLTATGGYSRALNGQSTIGLVCCEIVNTAQGPELVELEIPERFETSQNSSIYALNLIRQGELFTLNATASRQLAPTGFAFLSRQDSYELKGAYVLSQRWSFSADARYQRYQNPALAGTAEAPVTVEPEVRVQYYSLSANWAWTEHLSLALTAARIANTAPSVLGSPGYSVASNEVTLTLSRQFDHITF